MMNMMDQRSRSLKMCGCGRLVYKRGNKRVWKQLHRKYGDRVSGGEYSTMRLNFMLAILKNSHKQ